MTNPTPPQPTAEDMAVDLQGVLDSTWKYSEHPDVKFDSDAHAEWLRLACRRALYAEARVQELEGR